MDSQQVIEAIKDAGYDTRSYSGRGMFGKECLGVTTDNPIKMVCEVIAAFSVKVNDIETVEELTKVLGKAQTDSMGRDTIVYWPSLSPEAEEGSCYDDNETRTYR